MPRKPVWLGSTVRSWPSSAVATWIPMPTASTSRRRSRARADAASDRRAVSPVIATLPRPLSSLFGEALREPVLSDPDPRQLFVRTAIVPSLIARLGPHPAPEHRNDRGQED